MTKALRHEPRPETSNILREPAFCQEVVRPRPVSPLLIGFPQFIPRREDTVLILAAFALDTYACVCHVLGIDPEIWSSCRENKDRVMRAMEDTELCVTPSFSSDAINALNAFLFEHFDLPIPESFTSYPPYKRALADLIRCEAEQIDGDYRVLNLASGKKGWMAFEGVGEKLDGKGVTVALSDIVEPGKPAEDLENVRFETRRDDLLGDFEGVPDDQRFNLAVANYAFDSVWRPEDARYVMYDGQWYQAFNRLRMNPLKENGNEMIEALRSGENTAGLTLQDFGGAFLMEEIVERLDDIGSVPHGDLIAEYFKDNGFARTNFPGGLIRKVEEAFEKLLTSDGVFLIGDTAVPNQDVMVENLYDIMASRDVGPLPVQFKVEDYGLAKFVLGRLGYEVKLHDMRNEFCELTYSEFLELKARVRAQQIQENAVFVMEVRKRP